MTTRLPGPRGPLSEALFAVLRGRPCRLERPTAMPDPLGDDAQLALFVLHELAYRPVEGVDPSWECEPSAMAMRAHLERRLESALRASVAVPDVDDPAEVPDALVELVAGAGAGGPSLSSWMLTHGTVDHLREFAVHRSAYQLKEADPHSTAIARMPAGAAKTALLEIQLDEYGPEPTDSHAALFASTMTALGLDPAAGAPLDLLPAPTLLTNTLLTTLASSRRLLGALVGHLAVFEMCSVEPMARYAAAVRRLLPGRDGAQAARFYDVHVAADARHEAVAGERLVPSFVAEEPEQAGDVLFGAAALLAVEAAMATHLLDRWTAGVSSLRSPRAEGRLRADCLRLVG